MGEPGNRGEQLGILIGGICDAVVGVGVSSYIIITHAVGLLSWICWIVLVIITTIVSIFLYKGYIDGY